MRHLHIDCFNGVAGDMLLGALVDAGFPADALRDTVARLGLSGVTIDARRVQRGGLAGTHVRVEVADPQPHRHLPDILRLIDRANLPSAVTCQAEAVFHRLAEAEARVHGIPTERVHFHEVGAADAIVDVVGTCAGFVHFNPAQVSCSPIPTGSGTVRCAHGELPVPAPATAELLAGVPLASVDVDMELTTPTGAALATTLASQFGVLPAIQIETIGYGAGTRELPNRPNLLRLIVGEAAGPGVVVRETVVELLAQIDDAPGQNVAHAAERLLEAGALDVFVVPILMKKGRPGQLMSVLARPVDADRLEAQIFRETTSLGVRRRIDERTALPREHVMVSTPFGEIRIKRARHGTLSEQTWPEYEDCAAAARRHNVALRDVQQAALHAWMQRGDTGDTGTP